MLWGKSAGRCEFAGCNVFLWKSSVTQDQVNIAEKAHIYSFSDNGPRGNVGIAKDRLNSLDNLMLVCPICHSNMDQYKSGGRYTIELLQAMKAEHERRIAVITAIAPGMTSHVLLYGANIGHHSSPLKYANTALALFPERYPAEDRAIELGMVDSSLRDSGELYWRVESENLRTRFNQRVSERLARGELAHLSVFAIAPQPLLMLLGTLLIDITEAQVFQPEDEAKALRPEAQIFQRHREPEQTWKWPEHAETPRFETVEPSEDRSGPPALVLALSATISDDRITSVLGNETAIWNVTIAEPNNDFTKSRKQLSEFRILMRRLLDKIKARHGQNTPIHIFPAASVSVAVELGRIRMPKADAAWKIYDQNYQLGGFVHALDIP